MQTENADGYKFKCGSLSGVYIIKNSFAVNDSVVADISFEVPEGKSKIVLVDGENVYTVVEGSFTGVLDLKDVPDGKYTMKIVGVDAKIDLTLKY